MEKITDEIYEIGLDDLDSKFWYRVFDLFKYGFKLLLAGSLVFMLFDGYSIYLLMSFGGFAAGIFIYAVFINRKVLFRVRYCKLADTIEILFVRNGRITQGLIAKRSEVQILVRQNFGFRQTMWCILFYHGNRLGISQNEFSGWTHDMFLKIERNCTPSN